MGRKRKKRNRHLGTEELSRRAMRREMPPPTQRHRNKRKDKKLRRMNKKLMDGWNVAKRDPL